MKSLSNDKDRAIKAIAFAVICNFTGFLSPSHCKIEIIITVLISKFHHIFGSQLVYVSYLFQCVQQQIRGDVVENAIGGNQNDITIPNGETVCVGRFGTVTENIVAVTGWRQRQLKWCVEIVLLLLGPVDDLTLPHDDEATVTNVRCVHRAVLTVQYKHTGCTAACNLK